RLRRLARDRLERRTAAAGRRRSAAARDRREGSRPADRPRRGERGPGLERGSREPAARRLRPRDRPLRGPRVYPRVSRLRPSGLRAVPRASQRGLLGGPLLPLPHAGREGGRARPLRRRGRGARREEGGPRARARLDLEPRHRLERPGAPARFPSFSPPARQVRRPPCGRAAFVHGRSGARPVRRGRAWGQAGRGHRAQGRDRATARGPAGSRAHGARLLRGAPPRRRLLVTAPRREPRPRGIGPRPDRSRGAGERGAAGGRRARGPARRAGADAGRARGPPGLLALPARRGPRLARRRDGALESALGLEATGARSPRFARAGPRFARAGPRFARAGPGLARAGPPMSDVRYDELRRVIRDVRRRWRLKVGLQGAAIVVAAGLLALGVSAYAMDHFRYEPWAVTSFRVL